MTTSPTPELRGHCLVTGVAGFIGSTVAERLLAAGCSVVGIDSFTDYYDPERKRANVAPLEGSPRFQLVEADLLRAVLEPLLENVDYVFHEAAQAGVRGSWGPNFSVYLDNNVLATQRLLEACKLRPIKKFVYASSSSVYGDAESFPTSEQALPRPVSPYGVTKLAGEHLCRLYWRNYGLPAVALRYFTVYGPRQRPDMAFHLFTKAMLEGKELTIFGDGSQTRDFTYVDDIVTANLLAAQADVEGEELNIGGGSRVTLRAAVDVLASVVGRPARLNSQESQRGDARDTAADITKAARLLGYRPRWTLKEGLKQEVEWLRGIVA